MNNDALSQVDAEIEKLRQERSKKDEANRTEIDASITGLQWLRDKVINGSGSQLLMGIGGRGERVDVQAMRAKWEKHKMYGAAPKGAHATLHILARGAQYAHSPEDASALLAKFVEVLEFVWLLARSQSDVTLRNI
jgi:hypothetical protein